MNDIPEGSALLAGAPLGNSGPAAGDDGGLSLPTAELMALGGDARITLDEASGLNSYGCAPKPVPSISYASSTASTVSSGAFAQARAFHYQLQLAAREKPHGLVYTEAMEKARERLRGLYKLPDKVEIAFGPSGTDLEYLVLAIAMRDAEVVRNIVVEVDEVGSGCLNAQHGRYFAPFTALGLDVATGSPVPGFPAERVKLETVHVRAEDGQLREPVLREQMLGEVLAASIEAGERPLLHVVHRSKTGLIAPPPPVLERLVSRFGDKMDVVVDACQGRISPEMIGSYLDLDATVFVTGSKFLGGPPFSAFALVPEKLSRRMLDPAPSAEGLGGFFARGEMPASWASMNSILPQVPNFGLLLRLECGILELGRLLTYPMDSVSEVISAFAEVLHDLPENTPFVLLPGDASDETEALWPLDRTMLHTLHIHAPHPVHGGPLNFDDARTIYASLYSDVSQHFTDPQERMIAAEPCHVGQPVRCMRLADGAWAATLRLSLSAPHISQIAGLDPEALRARLRTDIGWIAAKVCLALRLLGRGA
jgi:hypothetical protein